MLTKKKLFILVFFLKIGSLLYGQEMPPEEIIKSFGFQTYQLEKKGDTIEFYVHNPGNEPKKNLAVFLSGSTPDPIFTYEIKDGVFKKYLWAHKDYQIFPPDYAFVLITKPGREGVFNEADLNKVPTEYLEKNSLDYRVWQADEVVNYCLKKILKKPVNVVVYGHSEGYNVVAKLLTVNKKITHAGLLGGSAMPDYFDFMMFSSKRFSSGKIDEVKFKEELEKYQSEYKKIFESPNDTRSEGIYTNKRWTSYAPPPINYLMNVKIPLYMLVSTNDNNAPIESTFIVPLEFARLNKTNLTYKICEGCDHSFNITDKNGNITRTWNTQIQDFVKWVEATPKNDKN